MFPDDYGLFDPDLTHDPYEQEADHAYDRYMDTLQQRDTRHEHYHFALWTQELALHDYYDWFLGKVTT